MVTGETRRNPPLAHRLFDHLVGLSQQQWRHGEAERFGSFEVDGQLKFGRLLDRQIGRFLAFEYPTDVKADLKIDGREAGP